tara:strand:- start:1046 stop:1543 length:498 start_codon:yes stop_codon:yes gene_type:complete
VKEKLYTLKLDASWRPIEVVDAYRGFNMAYSGRASVVEHHDEGPNHLYQFPSVIVLKSYISKRKFHLSCIRKNVFWRDGYTCQYCGSKFKNSELSLDHVKPKSRGGKKIWSNIVTACHRCNNKKSNKTLDEANMKPINKPACPSVSLLEFYREISVPLKWAPFLY